MSKKGPVILVVDDEVEIVRALRRSLVAHGYHVLTASTGEEALNVISHQRPDLLLLDLLLPGMSGLEVCRQVRAGSSLPIIVLSVQDRERDKVEALDLGADDYVAKPFGIEEVLARVRVALRRLVQVLGEPEQVFRADSLAVDFARRQVLVNSHEVSLTPTEFDLLKILITHRGKLLTRRQLMSQLWGEQEERERVHSLHVYVAQLRQKIEPEPAHPRFILNIPGVGYRFMDMADARAQESRNVPS